jgi:hypothetical protein
MGALSVVICAMLSSIFLNEKLSFFGWLGCGLCIVSTLLRLYLCVPNVCRSVLLSSLLTVIIYNERALYTRAYLSCKGPQETTPGEIEAFMQLFIAPGFLVYISLLIVIALSIIFYFGPKSVSNPISLYVPLISTHSDMASRTCSGISLFVAPSAVSV